MIPKMPLVVYDYEFCTYTITLFNTGSAETLVFDEHFLTVCAAKESELASWERSQIIGPPAEDGFLYYLCAQPDDVGQASLFWLKDSNEAMALRDAIEKQDDYRSEIN